MPRLLLALAGLVLLLTTGCGRTDPTGSTLPVAFDPSAFPDIPVAPGYVPERNVDQLAVSYAGGTLRRYLASYSHVDPDTPLEGKKLLEWYALRLRDRGWTEHKPQRRGRSWWHKQLPDGVYELLELETGRRDRRPIIRLSLAPMDGPGAEM